MDKCADYVGLISAYVDKELAEAEMARVKVHLESCENCSAFLDLYREISISAAESNVPAPDALCAGVMERVLRSEPDSPAGSANRAKIVRAIMTRYLPAAACLAVILLALPWVINNRSFQNNNASFGFGGPADMIKTEVAEEFNMAGSADSAQSGGMYAAGGGEVKPFAPAAPMPSTPMAPMDTDGQSNDYGSDADLEIGRTQPEASAVVPMPAPAEPVQATNDDLAAGAAEAEIWQSDGNRLPVSESASPPSGLPQAANEAPPAELSFNGAYARIEITGGLPELLTGYEPEPLYGYPGFDAFIIVSRGIAQELIKEFDGREGVSFQINDRNSDFAVVFYLQS